ncbi:hypothetical protein GCM10007913_11710 [Devosia yakushimensis]|uniref:Uncharacterized protein n=1 Tax=Devosia yakushimensis TaxID=470028 RepID=A0ABQ5UBJ5_9HYPH|nr:hypothetical protein [Devosia yakushimensis]GLQ09239.1 hypothetical protein GCM10007913_11710 [Devosia yakushimensis]
MGLLALTVKVGQAVDIAGVAVVRVTEKNGRRVGLQFATSLSPITLIPTGIIPPRYVTGITGDQQARPMLAPVG